MQSRLFDPSVVPLVFGEDTLPSMTNSDWSNAQNNDPSIARVITLVRGAVKPSIGEISPEPPDVKHLLREWKKLELKDEVLYRKWSESGNLVYQLVLPEEFRERALQGVHDDVGHLGSECALHLARARFYWPETLRRSAGSENSVSEGRLCRKRLCLWKIFLLLTRSSLFAWITYPLIQIIETQEIFLLSLTTLQNSLWQYQLETR